MLLLGENTEELGGSEYLRELHNISKGIPPRVDLEKKKASKNAA